jgi:hypothetical protein
MRSGEDFSCAGLAGLKKKKLDIVRCSNVQRLVKYWTLLAHTTQGYGLVPASPGFRQDRGEQTTMAGRAIAAVGAVVIGGGAYYFGSE